jgi:hypothetical protein
MWDCVNLSSEDIDAKLDLILEKQSDFSNKLTKIETIDLVNIKSLIGDFNTDMNGSLNNIECKLSCILKLQYLTLFLVIVWLVCLFH